MQLLKQQEAHEEEYGTKVLIVHIHDIIRYSESLIMLIYIASSMDFEFPFSNLQIFYYSTTNG